MRILTALIAGGIFGAGLVLSGMTDTRRVQGFLDLFGAWDPTLAFVMGGAVLPMALAWRLAARRTRSLSGHPFPAPPAPRISTRCCWARRCSTPAGVWSASALRPA